MCYQIQGYQGIDIAFVKGKLLHRLLSCLLIGYCASTLWENEITSSQMKLLRVSLVTTVDSICVNQSRLPLVQNTFYFSATILSLLNIMFMSINWLKL